MAGGRELLKAVVGHYRLLFPYGHLRELILINDL